MSPGLRPAAALALLIAAALLCYLLPPSARRSAHAIAALGALAAGGLLVSDAGLVFPNATLERTIGSLAPGVPLTFRADSSGLSLALIACVAALVALLEGGRRPLERAALLLCLAGACLATLAGNVVLLFVGLELGNIGALLMVAGGWGALGRRGLIAFGLQHGAALGLLAAAIQLQNGVGTTDLNALPEGALSFWIAAPWAIAGAMRLLAAIGLPGSSGRRPSVAWASVAAVPAGLAVLLRLLEAGGASGLPGAVRPLLMVGGSAAVVAGAALALAQRRNPTAAGRALCFAAAGPVIALVGVGGDSAITAAAASALALILALAMAPAWGGGGDVGRGEAARWLRALALAATGLPIGYGAAALLMASGVSVAPGLPGSLVGVAIGVGGTLGAVAAALAARAVLALPAPEGAVRGVRLDGAAATATALVLGLLPGLTLSLIVARVAGRDSAVASLDVAAVNGPGGGWAGGYLIVAAILAVVAGASAAAVAGLPRPRTERPPRSEQPAPALPADGWWERAGSWGRRIDTVLAGADRWLTGQPGLGLLVAAAVLRAVVQR